MRKSIWILAIAAVIFLLAGWAVRVLGDSEVVYVAPPPPIHHTKPPAPKKPTKKEIWIKALSDCESRSDPKSINPKDSDNTPSYGLFQFKPSTYAMYAKIIKLASTTDFMNPIGQRKIVEFMITDPSTNMHQQFPDCVRHLGMPPKD